MKIIAHRGSWGKDRLANSPMALKYALECGYGIESDIRDYMGKLVISHNIADLNCQDVNEVFGWLHDLEDNNIFAINIKADGLKDQLVSLFKRYSISNYFLFDMSIPQMFEFNEIGLKFFTRQSEIEMNPCMYDEASGVWIDGFKSNDWITKELVEQHFNNGKKICIVSPELHGREYRDFWNEIKKWNVASDSLYLCTDHPDEAKEFFYE